MAISGHQLTLSTRNQSALAANFHAKDRRLQRAALRIVRRRSEMLWEDVFTDTPKDTWFMATHLRHRLSDGGYAFEVGWLEADFTAAGHPFYPIFIIFGTRFMPARDVLFSHRERHYAELRRELRAELRAAVRRAR